MDENSIVIYQTEDGLHVGNVFKEWELEQESTVKEYLTVQKISVWFVRTGSYHSIQLV